MAHGDARERKWRGNWRMAWVASTLTLLRNVVYPALLTLMRTARLPVVDWTDAPVDLNGLVRFGERRNLVSARVPSRFKRTIHVLNGTYLQRKSISFARCSVTGRFHCISTCPVSWLGSASRHPSNQKSAECNSRNSQIRHLVWHYTWQYSKHLQWRVSRLQSPGVCRSISSSASSIVSEDRMVYSFSEGDGGSRFLRNVCAPIRLHGVISHKTVTCSNLWFNVMSLNNHNGSNKSCRIKDNSI
jgi:hypothetical protein